MVKTVETGPKPKRIVRKSEQVSYHIVAESENLLISPPDALCEFVDNALDAILQGKLSILNISIEPDEVQVTNLFTSGMGESDLDAFLYWGQSSKVDQSKIGRVGVGVKAASRFLAKSLKVECGKEGEREYCVFEDTEWGTKKETKDHEIKVFGRVPDSGYVISTLTNLKQKVDPDELKEYLANIYRVPIRDKVIKISVNGEEITPKEIPLEPNKKVQQIAIKLTNGTMISGWAGQLPKDDGLIPDWVNSGFRASLFGRMIEDGILFKLGSSRQLVRLIGELNITGPFTVAMDKKKLSQASQEYRELSEQLTAQLAPLISELTKTETSLPQESRERKLMSELKAIINGGLHLLGKRTEGIKKPAERVSATNRESRLPITRHNPATPAPEKSVGHRDRTAVYVVNDVVIAPLGNVRLMCEVERSGDHGISITVNERYKGMRRIIKNGMISDHVLRSAAMKLAELSMDNEGVKIADHLEEYWNRYGDFYAAFLEVSESRKK